MTSPGRTGASLYEWIEACVEFATTWKRPVTRIQPVIGEVSSALNASPTAHGLARMSGSGATCFAIYEKHRRGADAPPKKIRLDRPGWWVHAGVIG